MLSASKSSKTLTPSLWVSSFHSESYDSCGEPLSPMNTSNMDTPRENYPSLPPMTYHEGLPSPPTSCRNMKGSNNVVLNTSSRFPRCSSPTDSGRLRYQNPNDILKQKMRYQNLN